VDLGGRVLTVIPTPGHEDHHICVYDSATRILLSGDTLYPGKLVIHDWPAYRESATRLAAFARDHALSYVLGAHIELKNTPGELYEIGTTYQPHEHVLQLGQSHLQEWAAACASMGSRPRIAVHDDFILWPGDS
jgi:hydroxyacylglutathione hydrolase